MSIRTVPSPPHTEFFPPPRAPHSPARWLASVRDDFHQLVRFWPVVQNMVVQELRVRYQRSMLGFFWTLLNPILMMVTLTLVFSQLFDGTDPYKYAIYLFAGMVPWGLLQGSLTDCAFCIILHEGLIRKIYLPKLIFPLTRVLINLTTFVLSLVALFLLLKPLGAQFTWPLLFLPFVTLVFAAFALGLGLIVATMNTFFRDCGHLVGVVLQAWYFATPILYPTSRFPKSVLWRLWLNPAYPFIKMFQDIISDGRWPSPITFLVAAGIASVSLGVGYAAFKYHEDKLVFRL
jgi:homopolymeric O-antigen transport system permease protein